MSLNVSLPSRTEMTTPSSGPGKREIMPATPLIIDTDTASDDAVALLLAAVGDLGDLRAVTTVAGNVPLSVGTRNALISLDVAGRADVPVYPGCDRPVLRTPSSA